MMFRYLGKKFRCQIPMFSCLPERSQSCDIQTPTCFRLTTLALTPTDIRHYHRNGTTVACQKNTATDRVANSCQHSNTKCTPTIAHIRCWADISHITSQTMLGISRLGYSCQQLVAGYVCEVLQYGICRPCYVTASGTDCPSESEYDIMHECHECTSHTCSARRHTLH